MAKVYSIDLRLEGRPSVYVLADNGDQAVQFFAKYMHTPEGEAFIQHKIDLIKATNLIRPVLSMHAYDTGDNWPLDMHELDARLTDPDEAGEAS